MMRQLSCDLPRSERLEPLAMNVPLPTKSNSVTGYFAAVPSTASASRGFDDRKRSQELWRPLLLAPTSQSKAGTFYRISHLGSSVFCCLTPQIAAGTQLNKCGPTAILGFGLRHVTTQANDGRDAG